jgi:hypothetical protein
MSSAYFLQASGAADGAVAVAQTLAFAAITVAAVVLGYYLAVYVRDILVEPYRDRWRYLVVGVAAAAVYGVAGLVEVFTDLSAAPTFRIGATLFFFLFSAAGVRALYGSVQMDRGGFESLAVPAWAWYVVLGVFIVAWWSAYLLAAPDLVALVETVGLAGAVTYTLTFAVLTVRDAEGTSVAAVVRQFVPALLSFAAVVVVEQVGQYTPADQAVVVGVELVGTVLVGAFLFTTAVAIRQQGGELSRLYDQTTWRQQKLE